jgi:hypothetical protein
MRLIYCCFLFFSINIHLHAVPLEVQIHEIDAGMASQDETLVLLSNGLVTKVNLLDQDLYHRLQESQRSESLVRLTLDHERRILDLEELEKNVRSSVPQTISKSQQTFTPSVLGSMDHAGRLHRSARRWKDGETQCFNRAHVWSHDWWKDKSIFSMKMFVFFTRQYIRKYNFEWWFHVAPYVHVNVDGQIRERMMDIKYSRSPLPVQKWTDIFMRNKAPCRVITMYSDYANFPETGDCYLYRTSMYYYQPVDMELEEAWGTPKSHWVDWEVKEAYREAFGI